MKISLDGWSIVLAGFWNKMIFQPIWLSKKFFENKPVDIELAVGNIQVDPKFIVDNVSIQITDRKLIIRPRDSSVATLRKAEEFARKVLSELPHTPIQAAGINFKFHEQSPDTTHIEIFDVKDVPAISDCGYDIQVTSIQQTMKKGDYVLKMSNAYENNTLILDFNFSKSFNTAEEVKNYLDNKIELFKDEALGLIEKIYSVERSEIEGLT